MKEHSILFSTPMIQAILDEHKSQTRRIIKKQPIFDDNSGYKYWDNLMFDIHDDVLETMYMPDHCPYGEVGSGLWVRETWRIVGWRDGEPFTIEFKDGKYKKDVYLNESRAEDYNIECTNQCLDAGLKTDKDDNFIRPKKGYPTKWRPSIFMPKEACRIKLEIISIGVERVQDISNDDAIAEGIVIKETPFIEPMNAYASLWNKINGNSSWSLNPWVWVIEFKKL